MKLVNVHYAKDYIESIDRFHQAMMLLHQAMPPRPYQNYKDYEDEVQAVRFYISQIESLLGAIQSELMWFDEGMDEEKELKELRLAKEAMDKAEMK